MARRRPHLGLAALVAAALAACGTLPGPTASVVGTASAHGSASASVVPSPSGSAVDGPKVDLAGTAWRAIRLAGQDVPEAFAPEVEFDHAGRDAHRLFTGCEEFPWRGSLQDGVIRVTEVGVEFPCAEPNKRRVEDAFVAVLRAAREYTQGGDALAIAGPAGEVVFVRLAPPMGDPVRPAFDELRTGDWALVQVPGVLRADLLARARFLDRWLISAGDCGYGSRIRFGPGGSLTIEGLGWDSMACPGDAEARERDRKALQRALASVDEFSPVDGGVVLRGRGLEVRLGR